MATNDGYAPYQLGITAAEVQTALNNALVLNNTLLNYQAYFETTTPPTIAMGVKENDTWHDITNGIFYRVYIDNSNPASPVPLFFEV